MCGESYHKSQDEYVVPVLTSNEEDHILGHHDLVGILHLLQSSLDLRTGELRAGVRVHVVRKVADGKTLGVGGRESFHH